MNPQGFTIVDTPELDEYTLSQFETLPVDPYTAPHSAIAASRSSGLSTTANGSSNFCRIVTSPSLASTTTWSVVSCAPWSR